MDVELLENLLALEVKCNQKDHKNSVDTHRQTEPKKDHRFEEKACEEHHKLTQVKHQAEVEFAAHCAHRYVDACHSSAPPEG